MTGIEQSVKQQFNFFAGALHKAGNFSFFLQARWDFYGDKNRSRGIRGR
jgi:hypothetical protein